MATEGRIQIVLDSSVLINFLAVGRLDLLAADTARQYILTGHVVAEITVPEQQKSLAAAVADGHFVTENISIDSPAGELFAALTAERRLGIGECAAIAFACTHRLTLALDDKAARKSALRACPGLTLLGTADLMTLFLRSGLIDLPAADDLKRRWAEKHRFKLPFASFQELL